MPNTKSKQAGQTVITLVLPDDDSIQRQGSIIAKYESGNGKQSVAHVMPFTYSTLADIARAIDSTQQALESVKHNPPQVTAPTEPVRTQKTEKKAKRKKKEKPSLDDIPTDDNDAPKVRKTFPQPKTKSVPQPATFKLEVGASVILKADAVDVDGDAPDFTDGRICEIDTDMQPPRIWVESSDGEYDVWVHAEAMVQADELSQSEKPIDMGIPDTKGQLTLFE